MTVGKNKFLVFSFNLFFCVENITHIIVYFFDIFDKFLFFGLMEIENILLEKPIAR